MNYRVDVDSGKIHKSKELFLEDLFGVHRKRVETYRHLWAKMEWDVLMVVFTGSDRLEHFIWGDFEDEKEPYYGKFIEYFQAVDREIGWIAERLSEDDNMIILSDHGMERIETNVNVNAILKQAGILKLKGDGKANGGLAMIDEGTVAFAMEPSRIYLNYKGKYPSGCLEADDSGAAVKDIVQIFTELEYCGEKVVAEVLEKEDLYCGNNLECAPDLVLVSNRGFSLRCNVGKTEVFDNDLALTGMHRGDDAFLYVRGGDSDSVIPCDVMVEDIVGIMDGLS